MFAKGTVIKYVGNTKAKKLALEKHVPWHPNTIQWDFGIVEDVYPDLGGGGLLYTCRIVLQDEEFPVVHSLLGLTSYNTCYHYNIVLYDFEVEYV